ncbi:uncharacterized protein EV154DRAFT_484075 [Mucor mucedo]|uniref:uncharacterized protein n=1 Tax=Mucor mucedo TaxID=29922 RepID=UPI0022211CA7|nr:uncharacterized protein EV154DRAFT_484075 [Mucor mucedo]KAI7888473.1 hypothetical protein EV154DRAFT_484075 [Mucor mucedo]
MDRVLALIVNCKSLFRIYERKSGSFLLLVLSILTMIDLKRDAVNKDKPFVCSKIAKRILRISGISSTLGNELKKKMFLTGLPIYGGTKTLSFQVLCEKGACVLLERRLSDLHALIGCPQTL